MGITTVTRNYQITLPSDVRELEEIKIGDKLIVTIEDDKIVMKKINKKEMLKKTFGAWKGINISSVQYVRNIRQESEKRMKRLNL